MNLRRVVVVARKEAKEIFRDRLFFALTMIVPAVLMVLLGYGLSLDVENIPLAVVDLDRTPLSRAYTDRFVSSRYFDFRGYATDERALGPMLARGRLRAVIVIPEHFQRDLASGRRVAVQSFIDGAFPDRAAVAKSYIVAVNNAMSAETAAEYVARVRGRPLERAHELVQPVRLRVRYLYNQSARSRDSLAPKLIMAVLLLAPPFYTALGVVREKESGAVYNIYASTATRLEYLLGKLAPYVAVGHLNAAILFFIAVLLFGAPFKGSLLVFAVGTSFYVVCTTGLGLLVSIFVRTQIAAMIVVAVLTVVPAMLYSGLLVPVSSLSWDARIVAYALPAVHHHDVVVGAFQKSLGFDRLWPQLAVLAAYAGLQLALGRLLFQKRPRA
jgi:ABC-2 type transport system permease protein/ribosome-dependent ATPase